MKSKEINSGFYQKIVIFVKDGHMQHFFIKQIKDHFKLRDPFNY